MLVDKQLYEFVLENSKAINKLMEDMVEVRKNLDGILTCIEGLVCIIELLEDEE